MVLLSVSSRDGVLSRTLGYRTHPPSCPHSACPPIISLVSHRIMTRIEWGHEATCTREGCLYVCINIADRILCARLTATFQSHSSACACHCAPETKTSVARDSTYDAPMVQNGQVWSSWRCNVCSRPSQSFRLRTHSASEALASAVHDVSTETASFEHR